MSRISVVLVCRNERTFLEASLQSVSGLADELLVADMASTDGSREIAESLGATVIAIDPQPAVELVRSSLVDQTTGEWILLLDPDEVVDPQLASSFRRIADGPDDCDSVEIRRQTYMMGKAIRGTGWSLDQERHVRFFKRGAVPLLTHVHSPLTPVDPERCRALPESAGVIHHFNYVSWTQFLGKLDRYTTLEAGTRARQGAPARTRDLVKAVVSEAYGRGLQGRAWRDGWRGLVLVLLMMAYRAAVFAKHREILAGGETSVVDAYHRHAESILAPKSE